MSRIEQSWLPPEWTFDEPQAWPDLVYIDRPNTIGGGSVSLNMRKRIWETGITSPRRPQPGFGPYTGRSWRQSMTKDACAYLESVMTKKGGT